MSRKFVATVGEGQNSSYVEIEPHEENGLDDNQAIIFEFKQDAGPDQTFAQAKAFARMINECPHGLEAIRVIKR